MDKKQTKSMQLVLGDRITIAEARRPWYLSLFALLASGSSMELL